MPGGAREAGNPSFRHSRARCRSDARLGVVKAEGTRMIGLASLPCLGLGIALAALAPRAGLRMQAFETGSGLLLVSGLALLGAGLPLFR
ncbi:hypothetical protein MPOCJGCO_1032 [Methylobacterium trifolii]|uniref:Uncharacterized protein n=2 Tax=Methylobacterium trifolii TaxID=1003092 RepID=A0ABQ4TW85_9HYPH|nr:hypothetical protein MPOCJGCO_1032 [Methylobacterium trifolii]